MVKWPAKRSLSKSGYWVLATAFLLYNHLTPMATAPPPASAQRPPFGLRVRRFWQRITEGLELTAAVGGVSIQLESAQQ